MGELRPALLFAAATLCSVLWGCLDYGALSRCYPLAAHAGQACDGGSGLGPITFVQAIAAVPQGASRSVSAALPNAQLAADLNLVVLGWSDATTSAPPPTAVTDSSQNVYQVALGPVRSSMTTQVIYFAPHIAGATTNTVTVTFVNPVPAVDLRIAEYSGVSAVDQTSAQAGSGQAATAPDLGLSLSPELIVMAGTTQKSFSSAGSGYTTRLLTNPDGDILADESAPAAGSYGVSADLAVATEWVLQAVSLR
jgi:hypothetical protein